MLKDSFIETERLVLRAFDLGDARQVKELAGHRKIAETTLNIPHPYEEYMAREWIESHEEGFEGGHNIVFALVLKDRGEVIGAISLMSLSKIHKKAELGYWIGLLDWATLLE